jgi:IclR family acetate operon transcriptional repressor
MTKTSITTPTQLKKRIEEAARQGYARSDQGFETGVVSVAAPIIAANGGAVGAISVTSPAARADEATMARHGAEVRAAAASISAALGGQLAAA